MIRMRYAEGQRGFAIAGFTAGRATDDGLIAAVGILAAIPPLFIALWLQKTLVSGLTAGGSKG